MGDVAFGRDELDRVSLHACGAIGGAAADTDIPAGIVDDHAAVEIAELSVHLHIGKRSIRDTRMLINRFQPLGLFLRRERRVTVHVRPHLLLSGVCQRNGGCLGTGRFVLHQEACRFAVRYAVNFPEARPVCLDVDAVDLGVALACPRRDDVVLIVDNLAALLAHQDIVQPQIGVGIVRDGDAGGCVGAQAPRAGEVIRRHIDIAAAGGDVRDFHKVYGAAGAGIDVFPLVILLRQSQTDHVVLDPFALGDVGRQQTRVCPVVGLDHFVQFVPTRGQRIGIVKSPLCDAVLYAVVGLVVGRGDRDPVRHAAADGQVDGVGGARDEGAGDIHHVVFRQ